MNKKSFAIQICLLFIYQLLSGQYYETGQDPASLRWLQIKTGRFTVIYPEKYGESGKDFARALDESYLKLRSFYPEKKFRIPVVIHNFTTQSNGYVAWAPRRMEIYPTPEQNTIPVDPNTQLAIHELSHVLQMESLNRGFTRAMSVLTGEQFTGAVASLVPLWFLEGDAVFSESILTGAGRGNSPSFQKQLKAISVEKGSMYKYDKILNGSFRDFVPDYYRTGYQMTAWSHLKYDPLLWSKTLKYTGRMPFTINPVNISLSKNASLTKKRLFRETFDSLKTIWIRDDNNSGYEGYEILNPPKGKIYINYHSPVIAGNDTIIAVRTSLSKPPSFVMIRPSVKSEKRIFTPGMVYPYYISYGAGKLAWVESITDPRWENRNWSVIKTLDIKNNRSKQLTHRTRYLSASISPDGNFIAATENSADNRNSIVIIDAWNGNIIESSPSPENSYLQRPQWDAEAEKVTVIFLTEKGEGIMAYDISNQKWETLIEAGNNDLQSSFLRNDSLFFVSSSSGTDNIFLRKPDRSISPVTKSRFGINDLTINGFLLLFTDYSSTGSNISYSTLPPVPYANKIKDRSSSLLINRFPKTDVRSADFTNNSYNPVPYRKWQHLFRFHSWMPFYADIEEVKDDPASIKPGFTLMTQNNLSTLISSIGYEYSDERHKIHSRIKWLGWPVVIESQMDYGAVPSVYKSRDTISDPDHVRQGMLFINTVSLPLSFSTGRFSQYLYLAGTSVYQNNYIHLRESGKYDYGQLQLTGRLYFSNYHRSSLRDIHPRWAQVIDLSHSYYPFDKELYGNISTVKTAFYFPGILKNNGLKLRAEAERQNTEKFLLSNRASFSRSYENIVSEQVEFGSIDYYMPLFYPDFNISSFVYLKRIRTNLFYDITRGTGNYIFNYSENGRTTTYHDYSEIFNSFGFELMTDFYALRIPFMISAGVQSAWREFGRFPHLRLLFNIDLFGMSIGKTRL